METIEIVQRKLSEVLEEDEVLEQHIDLINHGLDSMKIIQLIVALEEEMEIEFEDEDLLFENFETIEKIVLIIEKIKVMS